MFEWITDTSSVCIMLAWQKWHLWRGWCHACMAEVTLMMQLVSCLHGRSDTYDAVRTMLAWQKWHLWCGWYHACVAEMTVLMLVYMRTTHHTSVITVISLMNMNNSCLSCSALSSAVQSAQQSQMNTWHRHIQVVKIGGAENLNSVFIRSVATSNIITSSCKVLGASNWMLDAALLRSQPLTL